MSSPDACHAWATLLPDAAEGLLSESEQTAVERHVAGCERCAQELADAQRGAAWLGLLRDHLPEPPADLLQSILARTSGADASLGEPSQVTAGYAAPGMWTFPPRAAQQTGGLPGFKQRLERWLGMGAGSFPTLQPRLAMTGAMAFFSVCLTLNLLGISVHGLEAESIRPAGLQRTVADTGASLVRSFEGIRMVYRVESRVNDWRTASAGGSESQLDPNR